MSSGLTAIGVVCWITGVGFTTCLVDDIGVFVVVTVGEDSILSDDSREGVPPVFASFGDWSWRIVDGGCKTGVCWDGFNGVLFAGVPIDEVRFVDVKGEDGIVEIFSIDT